MIDLIKEIRYCIEHNQLRVALGMALTLPDVCGKVEYGDTYKVGERYISWCDKYLFSNFTLIPKSNNDKCGQKDSEYCYKLRCAYLHSGNSNLNQQEKDNFPVFELSITTSEDAGIYVNKFPLTKDNTLDLQGSIRIDVRQLCKEICNAAERYYELHDEKEFVDHQFHILDVEKIVYNQV